MRPFSRAGWDGFALLACVALAVIFALPMFVRCPRVDHGWSCEFIADRHSETDDTRQFAMMWEVSRVALRDFHERLLKIGNMPPALMREALMK